MGTEFEVRLRNDPPAFWCDAPASALLYLVNRRVEQNFPGPDVMTGDYGTTVWTFRAAASGETTLTFRAVGYRTGEVVREVDRRVAIDAKRL